MYDYIFLNPVGTLSKTKFDPYGDTTITYDICPHTIKAFVDILDRSVVTPKIILLTHTSNQNDSLTDKLKNHLHILHPTIDFEYMIDSPYEGINKILDSTPPNNINNVYLIDNNFTYNKFKDTLEYDFDFYFLTSIHAGLTYPYLWALKYVLHTPELDEEYLTSQFEELLRS